MQRHALCAVLCVTAVATIASVFQLEGSPDVLIAYSYGKGPTGPAHWGGACLGDTQSPINIPTRKAKFQQSLLGLSGVAQLEWSFPKRRLEHIQLPMLPTPHSMLVSYKFKNGTVVHHRVRHGPFGHKLKVDGTRKYPGLTVKSPSHEHLVLNFRTSVHLKSFVIAHRAKGHMNFKARDHKGRVVAVRAKSHSIGRGRRRYFVNKRVKTLSIAVGGAAALSSVVYSMSPKHAPTRIPRKLHHQIRSRRVTATLRMATHAPRKITSLERVQLTSDLAFDGHAVRAVEYFANFHFQGKVYELQQVDFRTPSENKVDGRSYPLEMQMIHKATQTDGGDTLVLSWFFDHKATYHPSFVRKLVSRLPTGKMSHKKPLSGPAAADFSTFLYHLTRRERHGDRFYTFPGSLTTPPCTEGVTWVVMTAATGIDKKDLAKIKGIQGKNNRPVQFFNRRPLHKSFHGLNNDWWEES